MRIKPSPSSSSVETMWSERTSSNQLSYWLLLSTKCILDFSNLSEAENKLQKHHFHFVCICSK